MKNNFGSIISRMRTSKHSKQHRYLAPSVLHPILISIKKTKYGMIIPTKDTLRPCTHCDNICTTSVHHNYQLN